VDDALRVRGVEGVGDLRRNGERVRQRQRPGSDPIGQRRPVDQLQHEGVRRAGVFEPVDVPDVWVIELGEDLRLAAEAPQAIGIGGERVGQDLQRDVAVELGVLRPVDLPHAARADGSDDFIGPKASARRQRHGQSDASYSDRRSMAFEARSPPSTVRTAARSTTITRP
jgi:hypothetical protein